MISRDVAVTNRRRLVVFVVVLVAAVILLFPFRCLEPELEPRQPFLIDTSLP
jgi:hypothetical protein